MTDKKIKPLTELAERVKKDVHKVTDLEWLLWLAWQEGNGYALEPSCNRAARELKAHYLERKDLA